MSINSNKIINILFLYTEVMGYTQAMLECIPKLRSDVRVTVIFSDKDGVSKYEMVASDHIDYLKKSQFRRAELYNYIKNLTPQIIYISGWSVREYMDAVSQYKKVEKSVVVVMGLDNQWLGTLRQQAGRIVYKNKLSKLMDYIWVAGPPQYAFASRLGFDSSSIINNLYSADTKTFSNREIENYHRFLFVGRLAEVKGLEVLIKAYKKLTDDLKERWPLVIIGDGPLRSSLEEIALNENIKFLGFLQPEALVEEVSKGGVYVAPSTFEPWGVSIHEMAMLGFPMIISNVCGAASTFLINGYNGYRYHASSSAELHDKLLLINAMSAKQRSIFGLRSKQLAQRITSQISAASFLSVL